MHMVLLVPRTKFRDCRLNFYPDKLMTQRELAILLGVTEHTIRNIESGKHRRVSNEIMRKAAQLFKISVSELFPEVLYEINDLLKCHIS